MMRGGGLKWGYILSNQFQSKLQNNGTQYLAQPELCNLNKNSSKRFLQK